MDFFTQLFTSLNTTDSLLVLSFLFGAFLIGWVFRAFLASSAKKKYQAELAKKDSALQELTDVHHALNQKFGAQSTELEKVNLEIRDARSSIRVLEGEHKRMQKDLLEANNKNQHLENDLDLQTKRVDELKIDNVNLREQLEGAQHSTYTPTSAYTAGQDNETGMHGTTSAETNGASTSQDSTIRVVSDSGQTYTPPVTTPATAQYDEQSFSPEAEKDEVFWDDLTALQSSYSNTRNRLDLLESKLEKVLATNTRLETQLATKTYDTTIPTQMSLEDIEAPEERAAYARQTIGALYGNKIDRATAAEKNDLKLINGVGPFIEEKLNEIGIYTFKQISQFDNDVSNQVTEAIQFFPGRIQRDDWAGQAKLLMNQTSVG